ncbi:MAG: hypothetical protein ACTSU4_05465 [Promethearchaeota archaeon]
MRHIDIAQGKIHTPKTIILIAFANIFGLVIHLFNIISYFWASRTSIFFIIRANTNCLWHLHSPDCNMQVSFTCKFF